MLLLTSNCEADHVITSYHTVETSDAHDSSISTLLGFKVPFLEIVFKLS